MKSSDAVNDAVDLSASLRQKRNQMGADTLKVDPYFYEDPKVAKVMEYAIKNGKNILMIGPTGCGKSGIAYNVLARLKRAIEPVSCHGETSSDVLIGKIGLVPSAKTGETITKVIDGAALRAFQGDETAPNGKTLLLEELDVATPEVLMSMQRLLETDAEFYHCYIGEHRLLTRGKLYGVIATCNTIGTGEDIADYAGTRRFNKAFLNRWISIIMDYLPQNKEIDLLVNKTGISIHVATQMVKVADMARKSGKPEAIAAGNTATNGIPLAGCVSTRDLIEWAEMVHDTDIDIKEAAKYCFLNTLQDDEQEAAQLLINTFIR